MLRRSIAAFPDATMTAGDFFAFYIGHADGLFGISLPHYFAAMPPLHMSSLAAAVVMLCFASAATGFDRLIEGRRAVLPPPRLIGMIDASFSRSLVSGTQHSSAAGSAAARFD